jgi:hypothetical protein
MRVLDFVIAVTLIAGVSGTAMAQDPQEEGQNAPGQPTTSSAQAAPTQTSSSPTYNGTTRSHWTATGFVGSAFSAGSNSSNIDPSVDFGGEISYLWGGLVGAQFIADFAPSFKLTNLLTTSHPDVNAYMFNVIGAYPLGSQGQFAPYASGGWGEIQMRADVTLNPLVAAIAGAQQTTFSGSRSSSGTNIGGGFMWFIGNIGLRGDARYYHASTNNNISATDPILALRQTLLSDLKFWRTNAGVAFRW